MPWFSFHISLICMCLLQFNCFLLMPVVDKLPALLREDLESAFEDDLDSIFDITNLQHSLHLRKRDAEIELKRVFLWCLHFWCLHFFLLVSQFWHSLLVWPMLLLLPLQIKRLKEKFRQIHEQLCSHQLKSRPSMISTKWLYEMILDSTVRCVGPHYLFVPFLLRLLHYVILGN
jgi:hypothetical protein